MNPQSPSICVIILTYKRNKDLCRCVNSILSITPNAPFRVTVSIFNNDPDALLEANSFNINPINCDIKITNRPANIGPRENFCRSLEESHAHYRSDYYVFVSDDDYILPSFFDNIYQKYLDSCDAVIGSCVVLSEPDLALEGFRLRSHTYRCVPTRLYRDISLQFIIDSRLLSGTVYSSQLLDQYVGYLGDSNSRNDFMLQLWYPMAFIASFSKRPGFISAPTFVHAQGNETFWGDYDAFREFFLGRLDMFAEMLKIGNITSQQHLRLVSDFVAHQQSFSRIFYVLFVGNFSLPLRLCILNRLFWVLFFYRPSYLCSAAAKRLPFLAKKFLCL